MHGMLLDSRHADEHCDLRGGGRDTRGAGSVLGGPYAEAR